MRAILLSIGDELALGQTVDTNAAWLASALAERGVGCLAHYTVADDREAIAEAIGAAARRAELVVISGGLGPTEDDLTRIALADALGAELVLSATSLEQIRAFFASRGRTMPERNRVQALHPAGTTPLTNEAGTAPGIDATLHGARLFAIPGVPREMRAMFGAHVAPVAEAGAGGRCILTETVATFGWGESDVAELIADLMERSSFPTVGTTVSGGVVSVRLRAEDADPERARAALEATAAELEKRLGAIAFGRGDASLAAATVAALASAGETAATAESCTGGLAAALLTEVPGASDVFPGGWVAYSNAMKRRDLEVPAETIARSGAVSSPVAAALAEGARRRAGASRAVGVTGIAGPGGGSAEKPVGTVHFGLAGPGGTETLAACFPGDREKIRDRAAKTALQLLRLAALGEATGQIRYGR